MIAFAHPFVLLLLVAVAALAELLRRLYAPKLSRATAVPALVMPVLALVLLVVALSNPRVGTPHPTVLVVERSAAVDKRVRTAERRWTTHANTNCTAPCRAVQVSGSSADLESGLQTALGLAPHNGRVVVVGSSAQGQGDLLSVLAAAKKRDVAVDWAPITDARRRDASITALSVPEAVHIGDTVPLSVTVNSTVTGSAKLEVSRDDGAPTAQSVYLRRGDNPLLLFYTAAHAGWQSFSVTISLTGDTLAANNTSSTVTYVGAKPRVLYIGDGGSPVPQMLSGKQLDVTSIAPGTMPATASGYVGYDGIVLDDVAATQLSSAQTTAIDEAVRNDGIGLLVLGGPHSFSLGKYWKSRLQQILPVTSLIPGNLQRRDLAIELVLDHSGSMIDLAGGVPKITMARSAATETAAFIAKHKDELGIVDFDVEPHVLVKMQTITSGASQKAVDAKIATLHASGGTNIYAGLKAGLAQLLKSTAKVKHLILLTDGISAPANYNPLLKQMKKLKISVATVALGSDADRALLKAIAVDTGGTPYVTDDAKQLPKIFVKETQLAAKPVRVEGHLKVTLSSDSAIVRSLAGKVLPTVSGNIVTTEKQGAQADLLASGKASELDPALSEWQVGTGRVVTWTPGVGAPWGENWVSETSTFNDAVRWTERGVNPPPLTPTSTGAPAGTLQIDLANVGTAALGVTSISGALTPAAGGTAHTVDFTRVAPSLYQANVSSLPQGVYKFSLITQGSDRLASAGAVALPYPLADSPVSVSTSPLGQLVTQTGGKVLAPGDTGVLTYTGSIRALLTLIALIVFVAGTVWRMAPDVVRSIRQRLAGTPAARS
jgi:Ca-activated chloride channel homolog